MTGFRRALVAIDVSGAADVVVSALPALRPLGTEEIALVHVAKPIEPVSRTVEVVDEVRTRMDEIAAELEEAGFAVTVEVPTGAPAAEIQALAGAWDPDVLIVGTRSRVRLAEVFVGSVAWEVVRRARRPILLLPVPAEADEPSVDVSPPLTGLPGTVIYPTDFSEIAERALPWVEELVRRGVGSVTLLHARWSDEEGAEEDARRRLEELAERLRDAGAGPVDLEVRDGTAARMILEAGDRASRPIVVMGTHGRGFVPGIVLGSESRKVVRETRVPLLLVPAPETGEL